MIAKFLVVILFLWGLFAGLFGQAGWITAPSITQEIGAGIAFLIATVAISASFVMGLLDEVRIEIKKLNDRAEAEAIKNSLDAALELDRPGPSAELPAGLTTCPSCRRSIPRALARCTFCRADLKAT